MDFIKKAVSFITKKLGKKASGLGFLALHIVQKIEAEMPTATGKEKRDRAISEVLDAAATAGIDAGENSVRLIVEGAVSVVKEKMKPATAPAQDKPKAPAKTPATDSGKSKPNTNAKK